MYLQSPEYCSSKIVSIEECTESIDKHILKRTSSEADLTCVSQFPVANLIVEISIYDGVCSVDLVVTVF